MVISFEEKDRAKIEAKGVTIIDKFSKAVSLLSDAFTEAIDNVKFLAEKIIEVYHLPTSFRYKVVKFISRCTGIDIYKRWKMKRRTWLARSCC